jgi:putative transposase
MGHGCLTFMMLDADVVAVSPSSVWRVLQQAGLLSRWKGKPSRKGTGFEQPPEPHQHFLHQCERHLLLPVQHSGWL